MQNNMRVKSRTNQKEKKNWVEKEERKIKCKKMICQQGKVEDKYTGNENAEIFKDKTKKEKKIG